MNISTHNGELELNKITLSPTTTKEKLMTNTVSWEGCPEKSDGGTTSYRTIINSSNKKLGKIYLIIDFSEPFSKNALLCSWRFAPEKLMMGEQSKPEGKVTKSLRAWFKSETSIQLPVSGPWGHIDAAYDPHNLTGTIVCNYRSSFRDEGEWQRYCRRNKNTY